jgi:hypothetical protein
VITEGQPFRWLYTMTSDRVVDENGNPVGAVFMTPGATTPEFVHEFILSMPKPPIWFPQDFTVGPGLLVNVLRMSKRFAMLPVLSPRHVSSAAGIELVLTHDVRIPRVLAKLRDGVELDNAERSLPLVTAIRRAVWELVTADDRDARDALIALADALESLRDVLRPSPETHARLVLIRYTFLDEVSQHPALILRQKKTRADKTSSQPSAQAP